MNYKFTLLFTYLLIPCFLLADIYYTESKNAIHIYLNPKEPAILHIPSNNWEFIQFVQNKTIIKENLGSYEIEDKELYKSSDFKIESSRTIANKAIYFTTSVMYKRKKISFEFSVDKIDSNTCEITVWQFPAEYDQINFNFYDNSSHIFGGGIQFSHCNLNGYSFPIIVEENGVGRGDKGTTFLAKLVGAAGNQFTSYAPSPNFITNNNTKYSLKSKLFNDYWAVDFTETNKMQFSKKMIYDIEVPSVMVRQNFNYLNTSENTNIEPSLEPLEDWMYQYIFGVQGGKKKVDSLLNILTTHNIKVGAIWIQDWVGKRQTNIGSRLQWDWQPNETQYPNIKNWIDSLHQENIKVLGYINPYFVEDGKQAKIGIENNYFVKNKNGSPYLFKAGGFKAYMLDFANTEAKEWVNNIIDNNLVNNGFDGWMCDFGEWYPLDKSKILSENTRIDHNSYPSIWYKLNTQKENRKDLFIFNRSFYKDDNFEYPRVMWLGDQMGDFGKNDGLGSAVNAYNSASLSGFPIVHSDIGGYTAIKVGPFKHLRNDEVLQRWIEMEAFTPLWRSHEGLKPEQMSQIYQDQEMMQFFAKFDAIHNSLIPYFKEVNKELIETGKPMVRHPFLEYPEDKNTYDIQYQFFIGDSLLVCPVVEESATTIEAYLPNGKWQHFFTNEIYEGAQKHLINTPIGQPAVFWRKKLL